MVHLKGFEMNVNDHFTGLKNGLTLKLYMHLNVFLFLTFMALFSVAHMLTVNTGFVS